jgi:hypothetical protein
VCLLETAARGSGRKRTIIMHGARGSCCLLNGWINVRFALDGWWVAGLDAGVDGRKHVRERKALVARTILAVAQAECAGLLMSPL